MINENIVSQVNEQYNDALSMTKEMYYVCKCADNVMCTINSLRSEFEEARNIIKELTLKHAKINLKLVESTNYMDLEKEQAELEKEIDKYEAAANNKAKLIDSCYFGIKDLYTKLQTKFKNALNEVKQ